MSRLAPTKRVALVEELINYAWACHQQRIDHMRRGDQDAEKRAWAEALQICEELEERLPPDYWHEHLTQWFRHNLNHTLLRLNPP